MKYIGLLAILFLFSCKKDKSEPVINYLLLNSSVDTLTINLDLTSKYLVEFQIEDDVEVNQIRQFSTPLIYSTPSDSSVFSNYLFSYFLEADQNIFTYADSLVIPANTSAGLYEINISAIDKTGNEGIGNSIFLLLTSSEAPSQNITFPDFSGSPTFTAGDTIKIIGTVADDIAVSKVNTGLFYTDYSVLVQQNFTVVDTAITSWDFQTNSSALAIPSVVVSGTYIFKIEMSDNDGNTTIFIDSIAIN